MYLFKFDLKNEYHHIDIFEPHEKFLGFPWVFEGNIKFFVFTVLPFGVTSAPFIFTNVVRPLVKYWRFNSVKITFFGWRNRYWIQIWRGNAQIRICSTNFDKIRFYTQHSKIYMGAMQNSYLCSNRYKTFIRNIENPQVSHW